MLKFYASHENTWESSDDEMDLLGPVRHVSNPTSASRPLPQRVDNDRENNEDEVLTSDAEELAEVIANRSLEKYMDRVDGIFLGGDIQNNVGSGKNHGVTCSAADRPDNPQTPIKRAKFRSRALSQSSSPSRMTQTSEHDGMYSEEEHVSQVLSQTSAPDSTVSRYSPPVHRQINSVDGHNPSLARELAAMREIEIISSQTSRIELNILAENENMEASSDGSTMSLVDLPRVEPEHSPCEAAGTPRSSPLGLLIQDLPGSPIRDLPLGAPSFSPPLSPQVVTQLPPQTFNPSSSPPSPAVAARPRATATPQPSSPSLSLPHHSHHSPISPAREFTSNIPQGRTLRARTARQQHPYALEYAHYKNSMRRAGLDDAIVKLQAMEREKALKEHGHQEQVGPEMEGFIVPEDEESQDLYVPPATPSRVRGSETVERAAPPLDMEGLLANFGGMISDDESPAKRREKGKEKDSTASKKARAGPKPFPISIMASCSLGPTVPVSFILSVPREEPTIVPPRLHRRQPSGSRRVQLCAGFHPRPLLAP
ncbi:hypothetical protein FRC10_000842 [Ceratobasidium sp. 414]|nr:hypothetical protein FRC10_000842 [Ceratobasidium sp. 414]